MFLLFVFFSVKCHPVTDVTGELSFFYFPLYFSVFKDDLGNL